MGEMSNNVTDHSPIERTAFDYAWGYFTLHSGQRLQSVNFFILAVAFLAATYVSAIVAGKFGLAAGLALLGAISSFLFYRIERRIRGLIHAAEAALHPMEDTMASNGGNEKLRILNSVESVAGDAWSYSKVFRVLYATVGLTFTLGALYALTARFEVLSGRHLPFGTGIRFAIGISILSFGYATFAKGMEARRGDLRRVDHVCCTLALFLGVVMQAVGVGVLVWVGVRSQ
jgi:hypothetical protein